MLRLAALLLLAGCLAAPFAPELDHHWGSFKLQYGKTYTEMQDVIRRAAWEKNIGRIQEHNLQADMGLLPFHLGINQYADLFEEEIKVLRGYRRSATRQPGALFLAPSHVELPGAVDWREHGYVTPIKNQGQCGSCWAFSATGCLEGQHFRKTGALVSLSEQNLVDCSTAYGNEGCNGGLQDLAFSYIRDNKGIDTELSYPYTATDNKCVFAKAQVGATDTGYIDIKEGDEQDLMKATATVGPIAVGIDASHYSFQLYQHGVYEEAECDPESLDHAVLVIGYGTTDDGKDYWLIKNSWGESWGENGYMKMARNKNNMCGIASGASYPLV